MLNVLTKYSTMVTNGSTGSTSYVPMMPRAKGFCITTHKRTQEATKQLFFCWCTYAAIKRQLPSISPAPCALRAVDITRSAKWPARSAKILLYYTKRAGFWWPIRPAVPRRSGAADHKILVY
jgi:hypothetical protein